MQRVAAGDEGPQSGVIALDVVLMDTATGPDSIRFGKFDLLTAAGELRMEGRRVKLQPQPFKLLCLLVRRAGTLVTREEIRQELWGDATHVDFDQAVNFSVKQVREALRDHSERPLYIETVPRRGYRFIAPVEPQNRTEAPAAGRAGSAPATEGVTLRLDKALWQNVAELRLAEARRRRYTVITLAILAALVLVALVLAAR